MANRLKLNRIKDVLESKGISQTWLAKQIGKEFCTVNAYCGQRIQPNLTTLYRIAEILNVDFKDLITDKNDRFFVAVTSNATDMTGQDCISSPLSHLVIMT